MSDIDKAVIGLVSLPPHVLIEITSYLRPTTLKALSQVHHTLREIAEIHLFNKIKLPLSNPHYPDSDSRSGTITLRPRKPFLAQSLEGLGWREDLHQSNHLDASLLYLGPLLKRREGYVRELTIDLKDRYHDFDLDVGTLKLNLDRDRDLEHESPKKCLRNEEPKPPSWHLNGPISELDHLRLRLSRIRQEESPFQIPRLANTFAQLPILPGVTKLSIKIYESYTGYLPYLLPLLPNLTELVVYPHDLLVESPLTSPDTLDGVVLPNLRVLRVEPMLDCLRGLVGDWIKKGRVEELILGEERGGRGWTMDDRLAKAIRGCKSLKRVEVGKRAEKVLWAHSGGDK